MPASAYSEAANELSRHNSLEDQRALQVALELSLLSFGDHHGHGGAASPTSNGQHYSMDHMASLHYVDEMRFLAKKSQNMTECVPVPSSEHVAEIVGRQGEHRHFFHHLAAAATCVVAPRRQRADFHCNACRTCRVLHLVSACCWCQPADNESACPAGWPCPFFRSIVAVTSAAALTHAAADDDSLALSSSRRRHSTSSRRRRRHCCCFISLLRVTLFTSKFASSNRVDGGAVSVLGRRPRAPKLGAQRSELFASRYLGQARPRADSRFAFIRRRHWQRRFENEPGQWHSTGFTWSFSHFSRVSSSPAAENR